jgi:cyclohexadieny/prephenate dehydrogenase
MPITRVALIGVGLMGGSIALAARAAGHDVVTYDWDPQTCAALKAAGFAVADTPGEACSGRDLVFLCTPVDQLVTVAAQIKPFLADDTMVTEIGSVKAPVRALVDALSNARVEVVPSHPMAGSEKQGFSSANSAVIDGCTWLMCPGDDPTSARRLAAFVYTIGAARCLSVDLAAHDAVVAVVSHFPQMVATLTAVVAGDAEQMYANGAFAAAGGGFRDTTRVADSSMVMWRPILSANASIVATLLLDLAERCTKAAEALHGQDLATIDDLFEAAHHTRSTWRAAQPAAVSSVHQGPAATPEKWLDTITSEAAWLDNSMGWETVRTSSADPAMHVAVTARFLAAHLRASIPVGEVAPGPHHLAVSAALVTAGVEVQPHETWTADGLPVRGIRVPSGRFIIVT